MSGEITRQNQHFFFRNWTHVKSQSRILFFLFCPSSFWRAFTSKYHNKYYTCRILLHARSALGSLNCNIISQHSCFDGLSLLSVSFSKRQTKERHRWGYQLHSKFPLLKSIWFFRVSVLTFHYFRFFLQFHKPLKLENDEISPLESQFYCFNFAVGCFFFVSSIISE